MKMEIEEKKKELQKVKGNPGRDEDVRRIHFTSLHILPASGQRNTIAPVCVCVCVCVCVYVT